MKKTFLLTLALSSVLMATGADKTASININANIKYQHVTGFGGFSPSPTWQYWLSDSQMDQLFGKGENQLGLNILRLYMANNSNFWNGGVANAKCAKKHGAFVFASPWSPPASWKDNNSDSNGGALKTEYYDDWAKFLNDYYLYMKKQGVTIDAVSVQNEPDWIAEYQSCLWTGQQLAKFLREQGSKIECKIIAPEAIHFTRSVHEPILNDADACANLDIVGGHFYGWDGSSYPLAAQKGKEVWMTEFLINERQENNKLNIDWKNDGFLFASSINNAMLANMSAWVHYSLKRYYGCIGDGNYGTTNNAITKRGYILSHYAKYVSGTTRINHSLNDATGQLSSSAYLSMTGDSVVVMILNPSANTYKTTLNLPFNTQNGMQIVTTETQNVKKSELTMETEVFQPQVSVAAYSVNTYIFVKNSAREDLPQGEDDKAVTVFTDGFDLSGASVVPAGWRTKSEGGVRSAGNYTLGPRIMSFSAEGAMQYAFYFRSGTDADGYISYGEESNYRLSLQPGKYTLSYSTVGWKANPSLRAQVTTTSGTLIKSLASTPKSNISANGSSARITQTTDFDLDFEVNTTGNYLLKWVVAKASGGLNEVLVGNIRLFRHEETNAIDTLEEEASSHAVFYDLYGRKTGNLTTRSLYLNKGKKVVIAH